VCYVIAGLLQAVGLYWWLSLPIGIALMIGTVFGIRFLAKRKANA